MTRPSAVDVVLPDLAAAITYLFTAYQRPLDDVLLFVYEHQLRDVPLSLVREAVLTAPDRLPKPFVPSITELKTLCETIRRERAVAIPFVPCAICCDTQPGWDWTVDHVGTRRLIRCDCWHAYRRALARDLGPPVVRLLEAGTNEGT